jgi:hypothetical protein
MAQKQFKYKVSFHRYSVSRNDYHVSGEEANKVVLEGRDNKVIEIGLRGKTYQAEGVQIKTKNEVDGDSNDYTVTIILTNPSVFPVSIHYRRSDYYTASGFGTQGSSDPYILRLTIVEGAVKTTDEEGPKRKYEFLPL